ncbi:MAG: pyridoxamine 5'-phosphate oxidase family protein [Atopobiaceae bacterium]|nr:pyridoxamine 5'-phosphate oxidase family protein [Atopobiaceae bacterium]MBR1830502.1 pyridoxamine 5'-phosphate oxidase family protein [Atopobiaceae bacterium]
MFRKMRRFKQLLPIEKCQQILASQKRAVLSVLGDDGYPYGVPLDYIYDPTRGELGSFFFHSAVEGHKLDAIAACDKASLVVMDDGERNEGEWWYYVNSVICFGRASVVEDPQLKHDTLYALGAKYFPKGTDIEDDISRNGHRVKMIEFKVEHMTGKHVQEK